MKSLPSALPLRPLAALAAVLLGSGTRALPAQTLDAAIAEAERLGIRTGVAVVHVETGRVLHRHRADEAFLPASNQKLLTAAAVLHALGPDHRFTTEFHLRQGVLEVTAGGDPNWRTGSEHDPRRLFARVAAALQEASVSAIRGVAADLGAFGEETRPSGWPEDQFDRPYCAPSAGLVLDGGCCRIALEGGDGPHARVAIVAPPSVLLRTEGHIALTSDQDLGSLYHVDVTGCVIRLRGHLWRDAQRREVERALHDPVGHFTAALHQSLLDAGIAVSEDAPAQDLGVGRITTPLRPALRRMLKDSSNFDAEQLLRVLGVARAADGSFPGSARTLRAVLSEWLGAVPDTLQITDGSGLSREDALTPDFLARVLCEARREPWAEAFVSALPIAGEDGTLRRRFDGSPLRGRVRAKTGTLRGVSALSGYVPAASGEVAFVVLMNWSARERGATPHALQERIVAAIAAL